VLSTLHTNSSVETVTRLLDMGCDSFSFADAMLGVLAQRLTRRICKDCKESYRPDEAEYSELRECYGPALFDKNVGVKYDAGFKLWRGKGCDTCNRSGFKGRIALHELLLGTDRMKRLVQAKAKTEDLLKAAIEDGMTTLVQDGIEKVLQGQTTFKEVKAVAIK
jgi:type II secretory ATPase GspE/PulE/Tfp pilus assembly ATPase PilB-like protein